MITIPRDALEAFGLILSAPTPEERDEACLLLLGMSILGYDLPEGFVYPLRRALGAAEGDSPAGRLLARLGSIRFVARPGFKFGPHVTPSDRAQFLVAARSAKKPGGITKADIYARLPLADQIRAGRDEMLYGKTLFTITYNKHGEIESVSYVPIDFCGKDAKVT